MNHAFQVFVDHASAGDSRPHIVWVTAAVTIGAYLWLRLLGALTAWMARPWRLVRYGWRFRIHRRSLWAGCRVLLADGRMAVVTETWREDGYRTAAVLVEEISTEALSGWGQPPAAVVDWADCARIPRQTLRGALRELRTTETGKEA